jgi:hypothetical protein
VQGCACECVHGLPANRWLLQELAVRAEVDATYHNMTYESDELLQVSLNLAWACRSHFNRKPFVRNCQMLDTACALLHVVYG